MIMPFQRYGIVILERDFMRLEDITTGVIKENLLPARNRCFIPIRIGKTLFLEMRFENG